MPEPDPGTEEPAVEEEMAEEEMAEEEMAEEEMAFADVCPAKIVVQTNWFPEAEHGGTYQVIGPDWDYRRSERDVQRTAGRYRTRTGDPLRQSVHRLPASDQCDVPGPRHLFRLRRWRRGHPAVGCEPHSGGDGEPRYQPAGHAVGSRDLRLHQHRGHSRRRRDGSSLRSFSLDRVLRGDRPAEPGPNRRVVRRFSRRLPCFEWGNRLPEFRHQCSVVVREGDCRLG